MFFVVEQAEQTHPIDRGMHGGLRRPQCRREALIPRSRRCLEIRLQIALSAQNLRKASPIVDPLASHRQLGNSQLITTLSEAVKS